LSWQVVPSVLGDMLASPDREKAGKVVQAFMKMKKFDIKALQDAFTS
jgi:predicted 3-demethylubiquinone-9 3-methyltransferase (glyoxalase superfamily)